jgi:hypothetical protein
MLPGSRRVLAERTVPSNSEGVWALAADLAIRRCGELRFNIVHLTAFGTGRLFAAMETPGLLVDDIRRVFAAI